MIIDIENESGQTLDFPLADTAENVVSYAFSKFDIKYNIAVSILITDNDRIREINRDFRSIDKATDVLSFPSLEFKECGIMPDLSDFEADSINPEDGSLYMGDIIVSLDRVISQAEEYGHSTLREFAFLLTHSVLHLMGYDHMNSDEEKVMFDKQREILSDLGIVK